MAKNRKKTLIFILAAIIVVSMIGLVGCQPKLDGVYKGKDQGLYVVKIEGNKIQLVDSDDTSDNYGEILSETTFTREGDKLILATELSLNKYFEFEVTKGGNLIGRFPSSVDGRTIEKMFLKPEKK